MEAVQKNLSELTVTQLLVDKVHLYENNPRKNDNAVDAIVTSIKKYGFKQPCVVDSNGVLIVGHTRFKAAMKLGLETVPCVVAKDLTPDEIREYRIMDNKLNEIAEWDYEKLNQELAALSYFDCSDFGFSIDEVFGKQPKSEGLGDTVYNSKIKGPIYEPQGECPAISSLYKTEKFRQLAEEIEKSEIPQEVKTFLRFAAYRHIVFDYQAIAEYYAHAPSVIQELMEDSALVIIDFEKAIEKGFVALSDEVADGYLGNIRGQDGESEDD